MLFMVYILQPAVSEASVPVMMLLGMEPNGICRVGREGRWTHAAHGGGFQAPACICPLAATVEHRGPLQMPARSRRRQQG